MDTTNHHRDHIRIMAPINVSVFEIVLKEYPNKSVRPVCLDRLAARVSAAFSNTNPEMGSYPLAHDARQEIMNSSSLSSISTEPILNGEGTLSFWD
jgi:hypothetical protein